MIAKLHGLLWSFDQFIMHQAVALRTPWLNAAAVDITALGSGVVLGLVTLSFVALMLTLNKTGLAFLMTVNALGTSVLTFILKSAIERERPPQGIHLVEVSHYSYPSGHSLASAGVYLMLAILACRLVKNNLSKQIILSCAGALILLIGLSRIYLGVHYPTDVITGIAIGIAWALGLREVGKRIRNRKLKLKG